MNRILIAALLLSPVAWQRRISGLGKRVDVGVPAPGQPVEFTVDVRNVGADPAIDVHVRDRLPPSLEIPAGMAAFPAAEPMIRSVATRRSATYRAALALRSQYRQSSAYRTRPSASSIRRRPGTTRIRMPRTTAQHDGCERHHQREGERQRPQEVTARRGSACEEPADQDGGRKEQGRLERDRNQHGVDRHAQRPLLRAASISAASSSSSARDSLPCDESSRAVTACAGDPSKNVRTSCSKAPDRALRRETVGE